MLALYAATLGLSALLLFWVQPMFSKLVLPLLGGTPAVWNIAMVFFQGALLAGYLYAHLGDRWLRPKPQAIVHLLLLAAAFLSLPIAIAAGVRPPTSGTPVGWMLVLSASTVGLPFLALAATAPMLQKWFAHTGHRDAANPYILYAVSNLGSILALLAYPFVIEPLLTLPGQGLVWALGFALLAVLIGLCAWLMTGRYQPAGADRLAGELFGLSSGVSWGRRLHWAALAFVPASLLLGVTQHLATDVASAPLFWVMPLVLYLLTHVIVFSRRPLIPHRLALLVEAPLLLLLAVLFHWHFGVLRFSLPLHLGVFFFTALACHGELARLRPAPSRLTEFYLWMSLGGVLGGCFTALLAPLIFDTILEYPLALVLACLLRPTLGNRRGRPFSRGEAAPLAILAALLLLPRLAGYAQGEFPTPLLVVYLVVVILIAYATKARPWLFAASVSGLLLAGAHDARDEVLAIERSFFGVNRVYEVGEGRERAYFFRHGTTDHGAEYVAPERRREMLSYYHPSGPLGQVFAAAGDRFGRIGGVGLGIGTIACYRQAGQQWSFFEIDPTVVRIARDDRYFHFLRLCAPEARIVLGDGRLSLQREDGAAFDILVMDAFSSDAIPLHLLTRQAMEVYLSRLAPDGLLLFHVSNRHLDLRPVLADLAAAMGLQAHVQHDEADGGDDYLKGTVWVLLARREVDLTPVLTAGPWRPLPGKPGRRIWTDDYANLLAAMRWWRKLRTED